MARDEEVDAESSLGEVEERFEVVEVVESDDEEDKRVEVKRGETQVPPPASAPSAAAEPSLSFWRTPISAPERAMAPSRPGFSFGASSAPASSATSTASSTNNGDPTSNPDDCRIKKVEQEENTDEEILHEVQAKYIKLVNGNGRSPTVLVCMCYVSTATRQLPSSEWLSATKMARYSSMWLYPRV